MRNKRLVLLAAFTTLFAGSSALAHHGRAAYGSETVSLAATVTEFKFINPHVQIYFDITADDGELQHWQGELTAPNKLARGGWSKTTLVPGSEITISGRQARNGGHSVVINEIIMPNGESISLWEILD